MKRFTWILITVVFCAFSLSMTPAFATQEGLSNQEQPAAKPTKKMRAHAAHKKDEFTNHEQGATAKTAKKMYAHPDEKDVMKQGVVKKDSARKAPARMSRKMKKHEESAEPAVTN